MALGDGLNRAGPPPRGPVCSPSMLLGLLGTCTATVLLLVAAEDDCVACSALTSAASGGRALDPLGAAASPCSVNEAQECCTPAPTPIKSCPPAVGELGPNILHVMCLDFDLAACSCLPSPIDGTEDNWVLLRKQDGRWLLSRPATESAMDG
jgi:hypothetical protein